MPSVSLTVARGEKLPISRGAGLTAKGRAKYNRATGANLKAPQPGGGKRKDSFCARMAGVVRHARGDAPRARAALRRWRCPGWEDNLGKENPTMKRKPTPAQIAARERFAEMARSGAFKRRVRGNPMKKTRRITQDDLNAAARGLRMLSMSPSELDDLAQEFSGKEAFASQVIVLAARQMAAAKRRMGYRENPRRNPTKRKRKSLTRRSQATGRAPTSRLIMRRRKTLRAPKGFFANPNKPKSLQRRSQVTEREHRRLQRAISLLLQDKHGSDIAARAFAGEVLRELDDPRIYRVLARRPSASSWSLLGSFPSRERALQYARAYHRAASSPVAVKVTKG